MSKWKPSPTPPPKQFTKYVRLFVPLTVRGETAAEIHLQLVSVYGTDVMDVSNVRTWLKEFKEGREDVFDEKRSGKRPSLVSEKVIRENRQWHP